MKPRLHANQPTHVYQIHRMDLAQNKYGLQLIISCLSSNDQSTQPMPWKVIARNTCTISSHTLHVGPFFEHNFQSNNPMDLKFDRKVERTMVDVLKFFQFFQKWLSRAWWISKNVTLMVLEVGRTIEYPS
jgi:hypothetical protein